MQLALDPFDPPVRQIEVGRRQTEDALERARERDLGRISASPARLFPRGTFTCEPDRQLKPPPLDIGSQRFSGMCPEDSVEMKWREARDRRNLLKRQFRSRIGVDEIGRTTNPGLVAFRAQMRLTTHARTLV
jgi:hypothetical protein